jgi:hypothetical protein
MTPHPLTARRVCTPAFGAGGGHSRWVERGWGVNSSKDASTVCTVYACTLYSPTFMSLRRSAVLVYQLKSKDYAAVDLANL